MQTLPRKARRAEAARCPPATRHTMLPDAQAQNDSRAPQVLVHMKAFDPFPFQHATTLRAGQRYRRLLSVAAGDLVLPHQQWRVRFVGPALVSAALAWHGQIGGFVATFVLPVAGRYTAELLLEYNDTRLNGINPECREGALGECYLRSNTSSLRVDCMDAGDAETIAPCMKACNDHCGAPVLVHKLLPLKHPHVLAEGPGFISRSSSSPCIGRSALGPGVWLDRTAVCSQAETSVLFDHSREECQRSIIDCVSAQSQVKAREPLRSLCSARWVWRPYECALRLMHVPAAPRGPVATPQPMAHRLAQRMPSPVTYAEVQFFGVSTTRELMEEFYKLGGAVAGTNVSAGSEGEPEEVEFLGARDAFDSYVQLSASTSPAAATLSVLAMTPCLGNPVELTLHPDLPPEDLQGCIANQVSEARNVQARYNHTRLIPVPVVLQRAARAAPYLFDYDKGSHLQVKYHGVRGWQGVDEQIVAWNDRMYRELAKAASVGLIDFVGQLDEEGMSAPLWGGQQPGDPIQASNDGLHWAPNRAGSSAGLNSAFLANVALVLLNVCVGKVKGDVLPVALPS